MTPGGNGVFSTALYGSAPAPNGSGRLPYPGSSPVISWNASGGLASDAILWILDTSGAGTGPAKLYAYQAVPSQGQFTQKWFDTANGPWSTKFMVPTVANGYVYVGGEKPDPAHLCKAAASGGSCLGRVVSWH